MTQIGKLIKYDIEIIFIPVSALNNAMREERCLLKIGERRAKQQ